MFEKLIEILKENPRKIVFTEGPDARILEAADRLKKGGFLTPVLVGNVEEVQAAADKAGEMAEETAEKVKTKVEDVAETIETTAEEIVDKVKE